MQQLLRVAWDYADAKYSDVVLQPSLLQSPPAQRICSTFAWRGPMYVATPQMVCVLCSWWPLSWRPMAGGTGMQHLISSTACASCTWMWRTKSRGWSRPRTCPYCCACWLIVSSQGTKLECCAAATGSVPGPARNPDKLCYRERLIKCMRLMSMQLPHCSTGWMCSGVCKVAATMDAGVKLDSKLTLIDRLLSGQALILGLFFGSTL